MGGIVVRIFSETLITQAEATGFRTDILEKVGLLIHLLEAVRSHPFLKGRLALKGGTALNLFIVVVELFREFTKLLAKQYPGAGLHGRDKDFVDRCIKLLNRADYRGKSNE